MIAPYRAPSGKNSYALLASGVAAAVICFPLSLHHVDYRATFNQGLSVTAYRSSPAYAAFEDTREKYVERTPEFPQPSITLAAGTAFVVQREMMVTRYIEMRGMTLRMSAQVAPIRPAAGPILAMNKEEVPFDFRDSSGRLLPWADRKQKILQQLKNEDLSSANPAQLAQALVAREVASMSGSAMPIERRIETRSGTPIIVRGGNSTTPPTPSPAPIQIASAQNELHLNAAMLATHNPEPANMHPLWLTGQVEMTGGLAFVGPQNQLLIKRVFNNQIFEQGRIWITEGKFEIRVKQPTGFLVAELRNSDGRILGHGEINLLDLNEVQEKSDRIANLRISLHPTSEGVALRAISGYSHDNQKMAMNAARVEIQAFTNPQKVSDEGVVTEPTLSRDSTFVARALSKDSWPSLVIGQAREPQDVRLFANSMIEALLNLSLSPGDKKDAYQMSIVWGQLSDSGQPLAEAQVEMAGDYHPIYFNEMYIPDPSRTSTSKNGLFAFVNVNPGVQALRVRTADKLFPAQVFPTAAKHVSYVEVDVKAKAISQFKVFDGRDMSKPVSAQLRLVGNDETLVVGQDDFVEYATAANPFMVEADAGSEYEVSRVTVAGTPHVVHVPLVNREWLNTLMAKRGITQSGSSGMIVGYMDDQDFEVELTGYAPGTQMEIIYFDAKGEALEENAGVAGGGFAIFNAPAGLQTLYVHPSQSRETFSQVVVAEPQFVQVVTH